MKNTSEKNLRDKVERVLEKIRPFVRSHGGDVAVVKIDGATATLAMSGRCVGCALADLTYNQMLKSLIDESVPEIKEIIFTNLTDGQ